MQDVRRSFDRAKERDFAEQFYAILLAADPAIRVKFRKTNFEKQRELLIYSVFSMLDFAEGKSVGKMALARLAERHGPNGLDITRGMYETWLKCFVQALASTDPELDEPLKARWLDALRPGIERMLSGRS